MTLHLRGDKKLVIEAKGNSPEARYVDAMTFNGEPVSRNFFTHEELMAGGRVICDMSTTPNTVRGTDDQSVPYSFTRTLDGKKR